MRMSWWRGDCQISLIRWWFVPTAISVYLDIVDSISGHDIKCVNYDRKLAVHFDSKFSQHTKIVPKSSLSHADSCGDLKVTQTAPPQRTVAP
jgi:hypothetical protein